MLEVACWVHARRKFFDAQSIGGAEAVRILMMIGGLLAIKRRAKALPITPERLLTWRQKQARRRLARLRAELDRLSLTNPTKTIAQALRSDLKTGELPPFPRATNGTRLTCYDPLMKDRGPTEDRPAQMSKPLTQTGLQVNEGEELLHQHPPGEGGQGWIFESQYRDRVEPRGQPLGLR